MKLPEWGSGISKDLLRLKDKDTVVGVFRGEMVRFYQHWENNQSSVCPGRSQCELCAAGKKGIGRFRINFITQDENKQYIAKIFEAGKKVFEQLVAMNNDLALEKGVVRITRNGSGQETTIGVAFLPGEKGILKPETEKMILTIPLHDLSVDLRQEEEVLEPGATG